MDELADSASLVNDQASLRRRLADDGYLFFRGLLPAAALRAAGRAVLARLRDGGWVDDRAIPSMHPRAVNSVDAFADPAFRAAVMTVGFNRIPYLPSLRASRGALTWCRGISRSWPRGQSPPCTRRFPWAVGVPDDTMLGYSERLMTGRAGRLGACEQRQFFGPDGSGFSAVLVE